MTLQKLFLTFFGAGLSPKAPGTVGTLASLPVGLAILYYLGLETLFMLTLAITIIGIFEVNKYEKETGIHDHQQIVIDEAAGMWLSLMIAYSTAITMNYPYAQLLALKGGLGVMLDDVLAGIAGGFLSVLILMGIEKLF